MPVATVSDLNEQPFRGCSRCGGNDLVDCETTTSIWSDGKPYVIERIPALRCVRCSEVLIDNRTAETLRQIADELPNRDLIARRIEVPVVSFPASPL